MLPVRLLCVVQPHSVQGTLTGPFAVLVCTLSRFRHAHRTNAMARGRFEGQCFVHQKCQRSLRYACLGGCNPLPVWRAESQGGASSLVEGHRDDSRLFEKGRQGNGRNERATPAHTARQSCTDTTRGTLEGVTVASDPPMLPAAAMNQHAL